MYGKERANNAFKLFKGVIKNEVSARQVCIQIDNTCHTLLVCNCFTFYLGLQRQTDQVAELKLEEIKKIAGYLYINPSEI